MVKEKDMTPKDKISGLRKRAEKILDADSDDIVKTQSPEETRKLVQELHIHQIELEMQNEELRRTQLELTEARHRNIDLFDLAPTSYVSVSDKGIIQGANITIATMLGMERELLIGQSLSNCISKDTQDDFYLFLNAIIRTKNRQTRELKIKKNEGDCHVNMEGVTILDADGNINEIRIAVNDITDRKQAEEALQKAHSELEEKVQERTHELKLVNEGLRVEIDERTRAEHELSRTKALLDAVISQSPVPMVVITSDGTIEVFNEASREILGFSYDEVAPDMKHPDMKKSWQTYDSYGNKIPTEQTPILRTLKNETTKSKEIRIVRKDGTERWLLIDAVPVYEQRDNIVAGFAVFQDNHRAQTGRGSFKDFQSRIIESAQSKKNIIKTAYRFIGKGSSADRHGIT